MNALAALIAFLCVGNVAATNYVAMIFHETSLGTSACGGHSNMASYFPENTCIASHNFGVSYECLPDGVTVLLSNYSNSECGGRPVSQVNVSGCQLTSGDPLATYLTCVDASFVGPGNFPFGGTLIEWRFTDVGCTGPVLRVDYRRLNTCFQVGVGLYEYLECTSDGTGIVGHRCTTGDCALSACEHLPRLPSGCPTGSYSEFLFHCNAPPPTPPSSHDYIITQTLDPSWQQCTPRAVIPWVDGKQSGACLFADAVGWEIASCSSPVANYTTDGYLDDQCTFAYAQSSGSMACLPTGDGTVAFSTCAKLGEEPYNSSMYFYQTQYPGGSCSGEPLVFHGRIMDVCHRVPGQPGSTMFSCGQNAIVGTHCTDDACLVGCQRNATPFYVTDYCRPDAWGMAGRIETKYCPPFIDPAPPPSPGVFYMITQVFPDDACSTSPIIAEARLGGQCNTAFTPFSPMVSYTAYDSASGEFNTTAYGDVFCDKPLFSTVGTPSCTANQFMPQLFSTVTVSPYVEIGSMVYNATYDTADCGAIPADSVVSLAPGMCIALLGRFVMATCNTNKTLLTVFSCSDHVCSQQCTVEQFVPGRCFQSSVPGRSYLLSCPTSTPDQTTSLPSPVVTTLPAVTTSVLPPSVSTSILTTRLPPSVSTSPVTTRLPTTGAGEASSSSVPWATSSPSAPTTLNTALQTSFAAVTTQHAATFSSTTLPPTSQGGSTSSPVTTGPPTSGGTTSLPSSTSSAAWSSSARSSSPWATSGTNVSTSSNATNSSTSGAGPGQEAPDSTSFLGFLQENWMWLAAVAAGALWILVASITACVVLRRRAARRSPRSENDGDRSAPTATGSVDTRPGLVVNAETSTPPPVSYSDDTADESSSLLGTATTTPGHVSYSDAADETPRLLVSRTETGNVPGDSAVSANSEALPGFTGSMNGLPFLDTEPGSGDGEVSRGLDGTETSPLLGNAETFARTYGTAAPVAATDTPVVDGPSDALAGYSSAEFGPAMAPELLWEGRGETGSADDEPGRPSSPSVAPSAIDPQRCTAKLPSIVVASQDFVIDLFVADASGGPFGAPCLFVAKFVRFTEPSIQFSSLSDELPWRQFRVIRPAVSAGVPGHYAIVCNVCPFGAYGLDLLVHDAATDPMRASPIAGSPFAITIEKAAGHDVKVAKLRNRIRKIDRQQAYEDGRAPASAANAEYQRSLLRYAFGEVA